MTSEEVEGLHTEAYRLADPFVCLVCGAPAMHPGAHLCGSCSFDTWGDRFTWIPTDRERSERLSTIAYGLRISISQVQKTYGDLIDVHDYSDMAINLIRSIVRFIRSDRRHNGSCLDLSDTIDGTERTGVTCPCCLLHWDLVWLAANEDRRHGLSEGATFAEVERFQRERKVRAKLEQVADLSVDDIVQRSLGEVPC